MMSPTIALTDGTVHTYVTVVTTLIVAIGALLVFLTYADRKSVV